MGFGLKCEQLQISVELEGADYGAVASFLLSSLTVHRDV